MAKRKCSIDLSLRNPGLLNHSRRLITANRVLRLYAATRQPFQELTSIATFIMSVYAPMWFAINVNSCCKDKAQHIFLLISGCRYLSTDLKEIVDPVIQRKSFFVHPGNILIAKIIDDRGRELGLQRILKARHASTTRSVRQIRLPTRLHGND